MNLGILVDFPLQDPNVQILPDFSYQKSPGSFENQLNGEVLPLVIIMIKILLSYPIIFLII